MRCSKCGKKAAKVAAARTSNVIEFYLRGKLVRHFRKLLKRQDLAL